MSADHVFVARQPIFDRERRVFAYELLFRSSAAADRCEFSSDQASAEVMANAVLAIGLDTLTDGRPAFVNMTRRLLLDGMATALPPDRVVIEILEDISADPEVIGACHALRHQGYRLALDDFSLEPRNAALVPLADFIKVDYLATPDMVAQLPAATGGRHASILAEKIESAEAFAAASRDGCEYFQGYFFGRPVTSHARRIPDNHLATLQLLGAMSKPNLSLTDLEELVKRDASICYRLLRTVNSAGFGLRSEIRTIRDALFLLGRDTIRRWASVMALTVLSGGSASSTVEVATVRARFAELVSAQMPKDASGDAFLLGMCSVIDTLLGCSMEDALEKLPLDATTRAALLGGDNLMAQLLACIVRYEEGDWERASQDAERLGVTWTAMPQLYAESLRWSYDLQHASAAVA